MQITKEKLLSLALCEGAELFIFNLEALRCGTNYHSHENEEDHSRYVNGDGEGNGVQNHDGIV